MKKYIVKISVAFAAVAIVGCNPLGKMLKNYPTVKYELTPNPLELHGDSVELTVSGKFPSKYFHKKVSMELTPVLMYPADAESKTNKEFKTLKFRGEGIEGDASKVEMEKGGGFSLKDKIAYHKDMEMSTLHLKGKVGFKKIEKEFPLTPPVGTGTIITPLLLKPDERPIMAKDNFTKSVPKTFTAEINYLVNSSQVGPKELKDPDMTEFAIVIKTAAELNLTLKGISVSAYASPDGELTLNENLANDRAKSASDALMGVFKNAKVMQGADKGFYTMSGKGEDWSGFKELMQKSEIKDKDLILRILEMYSDVNKREQEIKNLAKTYVEVADKILPKLRRAQITLSGEVMAKSDEELKKLSMTMPDSLNIEELMYSASLTTDMNEQLKIYEAAGKKYPSDFRPFNNMGYIYIMQNKLNEAKTELTKAMDIAKDNAMVKNNMGIIHRMMGEKGKAEEMYKSATSAGADVNYNLALIQVMNARYGDAVANFGDAQTFNAALAKLLNGDPDGALKTVDASPDKSSAMGYYLKAIIGARKKNVDLLVNNLKSAVSQDSKLRAKAKRDMEFHRYFEDPKVKEIIK